MGLPSRLSFQRERERGERVLTQRNLFKRSSPSPSSRGALWIRDCGAQWSKRYDKKSSLLWMPGHVSSVGLPAGPGRAINERDDAHTHSVKPKAHTNS